MKYFKRIQSDPQDTKQLNYTGCAGTTLVGAVIGTLAMLAFGGHMFGAYVQDLMHLREAACEALMQDGNVCLRAVDDDWRLHFQAIGEAGHAAMRRLSRTYLLVM